MKQRLLAAAMGRARGSVLNIACAVLVSAVFAPTVYWLLQRWTMSIWHNGHGLFMPAAVALLIRDILRRDPLRSEETSAWGFALVGPALLLVLIDTAIGTQLLSAFGLVLFLPGVSLLLLGARRTRALTVAWVLAVFMLPIPAAFVQPVHSGLRLVSATGAEQLLHILGVTVFRQHTTLHLGSGTLVVADACSGFSTFYAAAALTVFLTHNASWRCRGIVTAAAVLFTVVCNSIRCAVLAIAVSSYGLGVLESSFHVWSGILSFAAVLMLLLLVAGSTEVRREALA